VFVHGVDDVKQQQVMRAAAALLTDVLTEQHQRLEHVLLKKASRQTRARTREVNDKTQM
jgi:hypothetical protein